MVENLLRRTDLLDEAILHDNDPVPQSHSLCLIMGDIEEGSIDLLAQFDNLCAHLITQLIVLRASKEETMQRAVERSKLDRKTNVALVETMWEQFCRLGIYESNVIETTSQSVQETVCAVKEKIASGTALLSD